MRKQIAVIIASVIVLSVTHTVIAQHSHREDETEHEHPPSVAAATSEIAGIIPRSTIEKAPSAELKPNQKDQDTLPPYEILDQILQLYVEENLSARDIISHGFDEETVRWVQRRVDLNEYKREQAAPGLKVTSRAFGIGRKMPIAQKYVD